MIQLCEFVHLNYRKETTFKALVYFGSCFTPKGAIVIDWVLLKDWARPKETKNACRTTKIHLVDVMNFLTTCVSKETLDANLVQNSGEYRL